MDALASQIIVVIGRVRVRGAEVVVRRMHVGLSIHGVVAVGGDHVEL
jgi:hypothetical protein